MATTAQFVTAKHAAELLDVPQSTIQLWCRIGRLPAARIGKRWLIPAGALEQLGAEALAAGTAKRTSSDAVAAGS